MARAARFKAWQSKVRKGRFYYHIIGGNSTTVNPSQHYPSHSAVIRACTQEWISFAKALGVYGKHTQTTFLATHPVPFTKESLKPAAVAPMIPITKPSDLVLTRKTFRKPITVLPGQDLRVTMKAGKVTGAKAVKKVDPVKLATKNIRREPAVQRILEGAKVGMGLSVPKTTAGKAYTVKAKKGEDLRKLTTAQLKKRGTPVAA